MDQKIVDFLNKETMAVLAICLPDGSVHSAAMHFVHKDGAIYFSTHANSWKVQGLTKAAAAVTVGFDEQTWITFQADGTIEKTTEGKDLILAKYPDMANRINDKTVFLKLTPTWHRYSNFKATPPEFIEN